MTQSPESSMLRAICACTASTSSINDGGLTMQPRKMSAATQERSVGSGGNGGDSNALARAGWRLDSPSFHPQEQHQQAP